MTVVGKGRVLIIAGSDSGGGAGIQGDIKTVTCLGGYAATAITALTAQNTLGVFGIHDIPDDFIAQQITLVLDDIGADAIKTGMLHKASVIETVAKCLSSYGARSASTGYPSVVRDPAQPLRDSQDDTIPLILDPVMFAKGGAALLQANALDALKALLIPMAALITPNVPEAEFLAGMKIHDTADMQKAAERILQLGCKAVLLKGGHLEGETVTDLLATAGGNRLFTQPRIDSKHTHGTGCALASAIATFLAQGKILDEAVTRGREYVRRAIELAPGIGKGHGPLQHYFPLPL